MATNGSKSPKATAKDAKPRAMPPASQAGQLPTGNTSDGTYKPWHPNEKISENDKDLVIGNWKGSSTNVRHAIQGRPEQGSSVSEKQAHLYDDWLNSGSYSGTIYRGKRVTPDEHKALMAMKPGMMTDQNGPASFSKSESEAQDFASGGYAPPSATQRVVFVLEKGTNCGQDISNTHGFYHEQEVNVGSASKMVLTKAPETKVIGGKHYTYIYGVEVKSQYTPSHASKK